jgi:hypothetical protein
VVDEKDVFRLKPDVLNVVEPKVDSLCVAGEPLLVPGLVVDLVEVVALCPPNMLAPLKIPPLFEVLVVRCISKRFRPSQGRVIDKRGSIHMPGFNPRFLETSSKMFLFL